MTGAATTALFACPPEDWDHWSPHLLAAFDAAGVRVSLLRAPDGRRVDYLIYAPSGPYQDFSAFPGLKAVLSLWAGVERVAGNRTLTMPLTRMVDSGMTEGMVAWVTGHVLRHHLGIDRQILVQDGVWRETPAPLPRERAVGILGLGELGAACARALTALGFPVTGWSRRQADLPGITCHSGAAGLDATLAAAQIVVLLLPQTAETLDILNARTLALLPRGAIILNPGRGPLIDDDALLAALDSGQIGHATLDVFRVEPLPPAHPFWVHPRVTVTPHIASQTPATTAAGVIAENIRRGEAGEPLLHGVDPRAGY